jgi:hypothetical protein
LSAARRKPMFSMTLVEGRLAMVTGVSYRWVLRDPQNRGYRMTDPDGHDLFEFKPSAESVNAVINKPTRDLLKQRGVTSATVTCRATSPVFGEKLFDLPITFGAPTVPEVNVEDLPQAPINVEDLPQAPINVEDLPKAK